MFDTIYTDVLCIGAGNAGERVAIEAATAGFKTICLSIVPARRSHSSAAMGGMQASLGNSVMGKGDSPDVHFGDTVRGSDWGCDQEVARMFADNAPIAVRQLAHWGVPWTRVVAGKSTYFKWGKQHEKEEAKEKEGLIMARDFGGTAKWRTCYVSDGTGHSILYALDNKATEVGVEVHDKTEAISLIHDGERCFGAIVRCLRTGKLLAYLARATLLATGGYGRIYAATTNAVICDGAGHALAINTGLVPLGNMEAIQFHPTGVVPTDILVTEGCRGDGGVLRDVNGYRFMPDYEPEKQELASRDVVSRRMTEHMRKGFGVPSPYGEHLWLDIRHLGEQHIKMKLREVYDISTYFLGVDPVTEFIPVRPTHHYSMGGIRTNKWGECYGLKGLYSAGEAANWDLHGFNRLGGNSLAETVVAGGIVGNRIVENLNGEEESSFPMQLVRQEMGHQQDRIHRLIHCKDGNENVYDVLKSFRELLMDKAFIFRNGKDLQDGVDEMKEIIARSRKVGLRTNGVGANPELTAALKVEGMAKLAMAVVHGALDRTESRGSHDREDYPDRNDKEWLVRTLAYWKNPDDDITTLEYEPATPVFELPPGDRGYGGRKIIHADKDSLPMLKKDEAEKSDG